MKKANSIWLAVILFIVVLCVSTAKGEDYLSDSLPSNEILAKAFRINPEQILGRLKVSDSQYTVFYKVEVKPVTGFGGMVIQQGGTKTEHATILRLDTNVWLKQINLDNYAVIQK